MKDNGQSAGVVNTAGTDIPTRRDLLVVPSGVTTPMDRSLEKRRLRKHYVLNVIRENGPLSRADISKVSGLNLPSVSSLVDELIVDGLATEQKARQSLRGRWPIPVSLREDAAGVLGIDIGKRTTTVLLANLGAKLLQKVEHATPELSRPEEYGAWALEVSRKIFGQLGTLMPPLCGIGVALPGLVPLADVGDETTAGLGPAHPGEAWSAVELVRRVLSEAYSVEVLVDNDARIMVPGARWFSDGRPQFQNFAVLNVGYGLGLGVSMNGRLLSGSQGFAGELGHIPLGREGMPCYCGRSGCLENTASGAALSAMAHERGLATDDVEDLAEMARQGDPAALDIFKIFASALGRGVATVINLFNPQAIILTGRVSRASDVFLEDMKAAATSHALPAPMAEAEIIVENPNMNLSSVGTVAVVLHQIFYSSRVSYEDVM